MFGLQIVSQVTSIAVLVIGERVREGGSERGSSDKAREREKEERET